VAGTSPHPTDDLDRLFRRVVTNLAALDPSRVRGPVEVAELYERLVPYRTHRTSLAMDTHEDYEMALLRLLAGERGYAFVEPEAARTALAAEVAGINPDTRLYRQYRTATVTFDPGEVRAALEAEEAAASGPPPAAPRPDPGPHAEREPDWFPEIVEPAEEDATPPPAAAAEEAAGEDVPFSLDEEGADAAGVSPRKGSAPCAFCGGALPFGRAVIFCPHCGQNVGVVHCPTCGTELDVGWRFCITCGRQMGEVP
jgi:Double zinc ribbon